MKKFKVNARGYSRKFAHRANRANTMNRTRITRRGGIKL